MKRLRGVLVCGLALVMALGMSVVAAPRARAYGSTALWQIELSGNCNNQTICSQQPEGLGGIWIWAELDAVGGNATETTCGHTGGPAFSLTPPFGGATHMNADILGWTVGPDGNFVVLGETDTIVGQGPPTTVTISPEYADTGIPAVPGHYSTLDVLGFSAPGVSFELQVVRLSP